MQAEVDKYLAGHLLLRRQSPEHFPRELWHVLFQRMRPDPALGAVRCGLYREASRYAQRFCRRLESALARTRADLVARNADRDLLAELRRFYRLSHARKRVHIERTA